MSNAQNKLIENERQGRLHLPYHGHL
ncbi:MAG: hypothetical protein RL291_1351, partial [Pseudomonadota bacterium]